MVKVLDGRGEDIYHIDLPESERWKLADFYRFPHAYEQCYSFIYCLDTELPALDRARIDAAFNAYPWKGGYSYVNIYTVMASQLPPKARPKVVSIHKASPGWLDLALNLEAAVNLAKAVAVISGSAVAIAAAYAQGARLISSIKAIRERAKLQEMQLSAQQTKALRQNCDEMAKALGFKSLAALHERTGNPEVSLKMLMAHTRRMKQVVEYVDEGKVVLPIEGSGTD